MILDLQTLAGQSPIGLELQSTNGITGILSNKLNMRKILQFPLEYELFLWRLE